MRNRAGAGSGGVTAAPVLEGNGDQGQHDDAHDDRIGIENSAATRSRLRRTRVISSMDEPE
jgi:hypothetical protein